MEDLEKCWCNSGKTYQECHKNFDEILAKKMEEGYLIPPHSMIKNETQIKGIIEASKLNNGLLDLISEKIHAGMTTEEIDKMAENYLKMHGATSADYHYEGFPKHLCTSINDVVCHGIPSNYQELKEGDIVNVDTTLEFNGYYADASRMYEIGKVSDKAHKLVRVTKECLEKGIESIKPYQSTLNDIGLAIEKHAHKNGYSVVEEYCGHGVGLSMHEDPFVLHYSIKNKTYLLVPGMVFTIEPMINEGSKHIYLDFKDHWTVRTMDYKLSAQWENTMVVTEDGVLILSK